MRALLGYCMGTLPYSYSILSLVFLVNTLLRSNCYVFVNKKKFCNIAQKGWAVFVQQNERIGQFDRSFFAFIFHQIFFISLRSG